MSKPISQSEAPKHIWLQWIGMDQVDLEAEYPEGWDGPQDEVTWCQGRQYDTDIRYALAEGAEFEALMERAREALGSYPHSAIGKEGALRDILAYFGEAP